MLKTFKRLFLPPQAPSRTPSPVIEMKVTADEIPGGYYAISVILRHKDNIYSSGAGVEKESQVHEVLEKVQDLMVDINNQIFGTVLDKSLNELADDRRIRE